MTENERSFLIKEMPALDGAERAEIRQDYLSSGPQPLRVRHIGGKYELTKKLDIDPSDMSRKNELTIPLTEDEYREQLLLSKRGLVKTRYYLPLPGGLTAEIDVFRGALDGLAMVEVEFPDEAARESFTPPPWFGRDVSQEAWSANSWLAGRSFSEVEPFLKE